MDQKRVVIATMNRGKIREILALCADIPVVWTPMADLGDPPVVEETGATFQENAQLKAEAIFRWSGLPTLAEDSGLEVDALGGAPGVRSARFAGENATDDENVALLLERLREVPDERRAARFKAVATLWWSGHGTEALTDEAEGSVEGVIARSPAGKSGFGYDPVFIPEGYRRTFAELGQEAKNRLSHRSRAFSRLREMIVERLGSSPSR